MVNCITITTARATEPNIIQGRYFPHLVLVRSAIPPMIGSLIASKIVISIIHVPITAADTPAISVIKFMANLFLNAMINVVAAPPNP